MVFILVQLDDGGVPTAQGGSEPAHGLCLPAGLKQVEELFILSIGERTAWGGGRGRILGGHRRQEQCCWGRGAGGGCVGTEEWMDLTSSITGAGPAHPGLVGAPVK